MTVGSQVWAEYRKVSSLALGGQEVCLEEAASNLSLEARWSLVLPGVTPSPASLLSQAIFLAAQPLLTRLCKDFCFPRPPREGAAKVVGAVAAPLEGNDVFEGHAIVGGLPLRPFLVLSSLPAVVLQGRP